MRTSKKKVVASPKPAPPPKKTSLSDREYVCQAPNEEDIACLKDKEGNILARYLPIEVVERDLDRWAWRTQNFSYQEFRVELTGSTRRPPSISACIELVIPWTDEKGKVTDRTLVGACNFLTGSYAPNSHFVATAKSECVKNAASDLGKKFGRGLNESLLPIPNDAPIVEKPITKMKPDAQMLAKFKKAQEEGDETVINILSGIYEFKTEENC